MRVFKFHLEEVGYRDWRITDCIGDIAFAPCSSIIKARHRLFNQVLYLPRGERGKVTEFEVTLTILNEVEK